MMKMRHTAPVVFVEDNDADYETTVLLLSEAGLEAPFEGYRTGEEALRRLQTLRANPPSTSKLPSHFILDLNLPGVSGLEVLAELRRDPFFSSVPVTMLTTSSNPRDVEGCYRAGANSYLIKPVDFELMESMLRNFATYWFGFVVLPGSASKGPAGLLF